MIYGVIKLLKLIEIWDKKQLEKHVKKAKFVKQSQNIESKSV